MASFGNQPPSPDRSCFDARSKIMVRDEHKRIIEKELRNLRVGDEVESYDPKSGHVTYSPVYFIPHDDDTNPQRTVLKIKYRGETEDDCGELRVSGNHLVYINKASEGHTKNDLVQAKKIKTGDYLEVRCGETFVPRQVIEISYIDVDVLNPMTMNHHIVVNGVHASVHVYNERAMRVLTTSLRTLYKVNPSLCKSAAVKSCCRPFY